MPKFGDLAYSQGSPQVYGLPVEDIKAVSVELTNRYNQNKQFSNQVLQQAKAIPHIKTSKNDVSVVMDAVNDVQTNINQMVDNQDFHRASDRITDMTNNLMNNAGLKLVMQNAQAQQENFKKIDEAKGYSDDIKNALKAKQLEEYKGVTYNKKDNIASGNYSIYNIEDAPDLKEINDIMKLFKSNKKVIANGYNSVNLSDVKIPGYEGLGDHIEEYKKTHEYITEIDVQKAVLQYLSSSPKYKTYYNTLADAELYKTSKSLGININDFNTDPKANEHVYNTIKNAYKQYPIETILSEVGYTQKEIDKLANDKDALNTVYEQALTKLATNNLKDYTDNNYKNTDIIKNEITRQEKEKLASLYGNVVGFDKFDSDRSVKENGMFNKLFEEYTKIQPFVTPGVNIDMASMQQMKEVYLKDIEEESKIKTQLSNLQSNKSPKLIQLEQELKKEKNPDRIKQLQSDIQYTQAVINKEIEDLQVQLGTIEMKRKNYELIVNQAIKEHPELQITTNDLNKFSFGSNTSVINSFTNEFKKQMLIDIQNGVTLPTILKKHQQQLAQRLKEGKAKDPSYNIDIHASDNMISMLYNSIHTMQSDKISKFVESGGTLSNAGSIVSMKGDPIYDGFMSNLSSAMDMNPNWTIIQGSKEPSIASKDYINELKTLNATSKEINLYNTTSQDPSGNILLNVTYKNEDGVPVKNVIVQVPTSQVLKGNMTKAMIQNIRNSKSFGNKGPYSMYGQQVINVLSTSSAATLPILEMGSGRPTGTTLGNSLSQLNQIKGKYTKEYLIGVQDGFQTKLKVEHDDIDGYKFYLVGGSKNGYKLLNYEGINKFSNPTAILPQIYNVMNGL